MPQVQTLKVFQTTKSPRWPPPVGSARDRARDRARDARTPRGVQHGRPPPPGAKGRHAASPRRLATGTDRPCCPSLLRRRSLHETPRARVLKPSHGAQYYKVGPRRTKRTPRKSCDCTSRPTHLRLCDLFPHLLQEWTARGTRCRLFVCVGAAHRGGGAAREHACTVRDDGDDGRENCREQKGEKRVIFTIPRVQGAPPTEIGLDPDG